MKDIYFVEYDRDVEFIIKADDYESMTSLIASCKKDLKLLDNSLNTVLSTFGCFLNKIEPSLRNIIIEDLTLKQQGEKEITPINFMVFDENDEITNDKKLKECFANEVKGYYPELKLNL